jgi:hypothetical protein
MTLKIRHEHYERYGTQLAKNRGYTQIPITVERFKFELNRKKSKFERYGLISTPI